MKHNDEIKSPKSVKISYNQKELKAIVEKLFRNSHCSDKKQKILSYLNKIEREINKLREYQRSTHPEIFYSSMKNLLLKIKNGANEIDRKTNKYNPVLSNTLKELILNGIKPLEDALREQSSKETLFKTHRLYAQQSFVCRQSKLQEELMCHLNKIKKFLKKANSVPPYCYISYAEPFEERKEEEYWVQPFLYVLYDHLAAAGIRVVMDIRDNEPGASIVAFTKKYNDGNYIILIGTESLLEKHHAEGSHVIQSELDIIENRFKQDKQDYGRSRIYPLLISGTIETAYPERYRGYVNIKDGRESDYLKMLKDLTDWIYRFRLKRLDKDDEYADLWNACFNSISNLPNEDSAVEKEILQNYHKPRYIQDLKQKKKKQKSNKEDKISGITDKVPSGSVSMFDKPSELPTKPDECGEASGSSISNEALIEVDSNKKLTDDKFDEVLEFEPEIINVSGFNDCCGLFALALAVKIAMREKEASESKQLNFLDVIDEGALRSTTKYTEAIAKQLKEEMYWALLLNEAYKERCLHSFTDYCRAELEGGVLAEDMSSFAKANRVYREELKALWLSVRETVEKEFEGGEAEYKEHLGTKLTPSLIDEFKETLSGLVISSLVEGKVKQFIGSYFEEGEDLISGLIKFNRLYRSVWHEFEVGTAEQRNKLNELYTKILTEKSITLLEKEQGEEFITALLKLSFLQKTSFKCNGELEKICDKKEIISTAIFLLVSAHIKKEWDLLYENYCKYIKENSTMLSADELGCLALRWKVQLRIQFNSGESYETRQKDELTLMHVILCNPGQNHWQVYRKSRNKPIKEIDLSLVDEPRVKLNSDELLISSEGLGSPFLTCEEELAELATLSGKKETEVNQINRNEETVLIFAAEKRDSSVAAQLLEKRANVNQENDNGKASPMMAAQNGHKAVIAQLLEKSANVNQALKSGATLLMVAAANGHQSMVTQLLDNGANVNQENQSGWTPLMMAVQNGHQAVVAQLLDKGAKVNQKGKDGATSLYIAAQNGHQAVVAQLLDKGADVNQKGKDGATSLYIAAQNGHQAVVAQLLHSGADANQGDKYGLTPLMMAALNEHESVATQLLDNGADVNQKNKNGWTPLMAVAAEGHQAVVVQLLKKGADVNQVDENEDTPLIIAAQNGHESVVAQLLEKEVNVNQKNRYGVCALWAAISYGHEAVVAQLLQKQVEVNSVRQFTPLMLAIYHGYSGIAKKLLEKGADPNSTEQQYRQTPLIMATLKGDAFIVKQLLEKGANVNQAQIDGETPLYIAAREGHQNVVAQLLEKKADLNQAQKGGETPLRVAARMGYETLVAQLANVDYADQHYRDKALMVVVEKGYVTIVEQLLAKGANVHYKDELNYTPLYIAAENGHEGVVAQLLEKGANVNQVTWLKETPLHAAVRNGHISVVKQLLKNKANVNQKDKFDKTPFSAIFFHKMNRVSFEIAAVLLRAGSKILKKKQSLAFYECIELQKGLLSLGEYEACLMLSDYRLHQEPGVRIEERVIAYYAQGKLDKAFEYLKVLKKKNRQEDRAFIAYSSGYLKMEKGEFDLAVKDYEAALQEDKDNNRVRYDRILAELYKTGNPEAILERLEELPNPEAFQNKQDAIYSYHVKGFIYHQCLQHEKALVCFNEALRCDKEDIFALAKRGFLLLCQGKREEGLKDLDAALAINPYYSGALARRGYGLALEGLFEGAGDYFKRSLEVNPSHFETLLLKGASLILQKRLVKAKECIEKTFVVSISRSLLIAQHMPQEVKEKIIDYAFEYSLKDKEKLKEVLQVLLRLQLFSEKTLEKVEFYLMKTYSEEELNVLLGTVSESSPLYELLCQIVLNNAKKHQMEKEQREAYFKTKQKELYNQLMQLTDENLLATQKENIQKEIKQLVETKEPVDDLRNLLNQCVEPTELEIEYNNRNAFQRLFVSKEEFLIKQLAEKIGEIDKFVREHSSLSYQSVRDSLETIRAIYDEYQKNVSGLVNNKELQGEERKKRLNELYTPRCRLSMTFFRDRYLKKEVQSLLAPHEGEMEEKKAENVYGTHVVKKCGEVHFKYHANNNPCYPVIEYMVGTLYSLLARTAYGTAPTEIVKLQYKGYERILVASQTIKGINLHDFLTHHVEHEPQLIEQFDSHSFSTMIITSLLSNPVDGKPDNYMVQFFQDEKDEQKIKVLGFDNDLAFGEPVVKIREGKLTQVGQPVVKKDEDKRVVRARAGQHFVEVRNVFYFFPQMNLPIDPTLCKRLVEASPELLMLEFICSLQKQDEHYKQLLKEGVLSAEEGEALQLPICFPREETLGIMYKRLRAIQRCLKKDSQLSHMELFYALYPEMAKYYEKVASENQAKPKAILESIAKLYAASAPTLEEAGLISEQKSIVTMSRVAIKTMEKGECAKPVYPLLKGIEKFVESIRFSEISVERQRQILEKIKSLSGIEQLTIRNCEGLDDKLLQTLVEDLPTLRRLNLVDCSQIKAESIAMASPRGKVVEIQIMQEKSKKQALTPQFEQFSVQSGKSEKEAGKEEEIMQESPKGIKFNK